MKKDSFIKVVIPFFCLLIIFACVYAVLSNPVSVSKQEEVFYDRRSEDGSDPKIWKLYNELQDSCAKMNAGFAIDSLKTIENVKFWQKDTIVDYLIEFREGGSCLGRNHIEVDPRNNVAIGDTVVYKKHFVVNFNFVTGEGEIGTFTGVAFFNKDEGHYYWL